MTLFAWIVLGLLAGFIASHLVNHRGEGMVLDILLGIVGAVVGGWLAHLAGLIPEIHVEKLDARTPREAPPTA